MKTLKVLELGSYIAPAYAGMILAEQGHIVEKWTTKDPIHDLNQGQQLWDWINYGKNLKRIDAANITHVAPGAYDIIIDNTRQSTWQKRGINPKTLAQQLNVTWVALQPDVGTRSFDVIAQARAWGDKGILPFYIGDTAAGLWLAFKALSNTTGYHTIGHATALAKLVEGEEVLTRPVGDFPYDTPDDYTWTGTHAQVRFKGETLSEPARDSQWRLANLPNTNGRFHV